MKDKLKTRFIEFKNDRLVQGIVLGGVVSTVTCITSAKLMKVNFTDPDNTLHIPDHVIDAILTTGLPALLTREDGVQLALGIS